MKRNKLFILSILPILSLTSCKLLPIEIGSKSNVDFSNLEPVANENNLISFEEMNNQITLWESNDYNFIENVNYVKVDSYLESTSNWINIYLPLEQQYSFIEDDLKLSFKAKYPKIITELLNDNEPKTTSEENSGPGNIFDTIKAIKEVDEGKIELVKTSARKLKVKDFDEELWNELTKDISVNVEIENINYTYTFPTKEKFLKLTNLTEESEFPEILTITFDTLPDGTSLPDNLENIDVEYELPEELTQNYDFYTLNQENLDFLFANISEFNEIINKELPNVNNIIQDEILTKFYLPQIGEGSFQIPLNFNVTLNSLTYKDKVYNETNTFYKLDDNTYKVLLPNQRGYYHINKNGLFISSFLDISVENSKYVSTKVHTKYTYNSNLIPEDEENITKK